MTGRWSFLHRVVIRSAGFPVTWLRSLQSPRAVALVQDILTHDRQIEDAASELRAWLDHLAASAVDPSVRTATRRVRRLIRRLREVPPHRHPADWRTRLTLWNDLARRRAAAIAAARSAWTTECARLRQRLQDLASTAAVQEAVFASSPGALTGIRRLAVGRADTSTRRVAVRYLQRFCAKAETGSIAGPLNYGTLDPTTSRAIGTKVHGDGRSSERRVVVSFWAAQAIADAWAAEPALTGLNRLYRNARRPLSEAPPANRQLLNLSDGEHPLTEVARRLDEPLPAVYARAQVLAADGWLQIGIKIPATEADPVAALRRLVAGSRTTASVDPVVSTLHAQVDELERWRDRFQQADLADREELLPAGEALVTRYAQTTDLPVRRGQGTFYADRFCYTEEAVGNIAELVLGRPVIDELRRDLSPMLDILASEAVTEREGQRTALEALVTSGGVPAAPLLGCPLPPAPDRTGRWAEAVGSTGRTADLDPDRLRRAGILRDDLARWPLFCAPDLMLVADSPEAIERGDWQVVLAEVHHISPPTQLPCLAFEPEPARVRAEVGKALRTITDGAQPVIQGVQWRNKVRDHTPAGHNLLWLDWYGGGGGTPGTAVGDCTVTTGPDGPELRSDMGERLALIPDYEDLGPELGMLRSVALPQIDKRPVRLGSRTPRLSCGRVIYQRERWDLSAGHRPTTDAPFHSFEAFLEAWRWKETWEMPDQVFIRVDSEDKPLLLDFNSPLSVETAMRQLVNGDGHLGVEEMLPTFDQLWLHTNDGPLCSELRLAAYRDLEERTGRD
jgi:hypothetical protein